MLQHARPFAKQSSQGIVRERQEVAGICYPQRRAADKSAG
jgi:hypothetical protein